MEYEILPRRSEAKAGYPPKRSEGGASEPAIALTLVRAVGDLSRNDLATRPSGHAGPPVATPAAQCLGRHRFEIGVRAARIRSRRPRISSRAPALLPCLHGWWPRASQGAKHLRRRSFLGIAGSTAGVVLSALKKAEDRDSVIVRLFNPGDRAADATLKPGFAVKQVFAVNFLEERQEQIAIENGTVAVQLRPHQIQTIELTR